MKKSILTLSVIALLAGACKKDSTPQSLIVGKWYEKKTVTSHHFTSSTMQDYTETGIGFTDADWMIFNSNGTFSVSADLETNGMTGTYSVSGNQLTLNKGTGTIKTLDAHTLIIDTQETDGNDILSSEKTFSR